MEHEKTEKTERFAYSVSIVGCLLVEAKAVDKIHPINKAQLLSYMKLLDVPLGLLFNFHNLKLSEGVTRLILPGANLE